MKADPKADAAPAASSNKRLLIILIAVLVVGLAGGAGWFFTRATPANAQAQKNAPAEAPVFVPLDQFTVNLQPENGDQYLQIQFTLQVPNLQQVELVKNNMPKVRSRVLLLLSGKRASEISTVEGKHQLATEIIAAVKQPFSDKGEPQQVSDVLFTAFIIQ
jgi:flagellar FliL protein